MNPFCLHCKDSFILIIHLGTKKWLLWFSFAWQVYAFDISIWNAFEIIHELRDLNGLAGYSRMKERFLKQQQQHWSKDDAEKPVKYFCFSCKHVWNLSDEISEFQSIFQRSKVYLSLTFQTVLPIKRQFRR